MYGCCARSRCSPSHPIITTTTLPSSALSRVPLLSLSLSLCLSLSFDAPFSMTSRINGKSGLLNDRSRDTRIVSVAHATSASTFFRFFSLITRRSAPRGLWRFVRAEFFDRFNFLSLRNFTSFVVPLFEQFVLRFLTLPTTRESLDLKNVGLPLGFFA